MGDYAVIGHYKFMDDAIRCIRAVREKGYTLKELEVFSNCPIHELEDELYIGQKKSAVRKFVLFGGLLGCTLAFLMTCWMSLDYPIRVSAKPFVSIPAFVIIGFECTILIGTLFNVLGVLSLAKLPKLFRNHAFRPNFTDGTFGVTLRVDKDSTGAIEELFKSTGAQQVEVQYVR